MDGCTTGAATAAGAAEAFFVPFFLINDIGLCAPIVRHAPIIYCLTAVEIMSTKVTLAFLHADSTALESHWMSTAAKRLAQRAGLEPYIHVELLFPDGNSYSITATTGKVHKVATKEFSRSEWEFVDLYLSPPQIQAAQLFCNQTYLRGAGFNWTGYALSTVWPWSGNNEKFFCSEFVATALQAGGLLPGVEPASLMPAQLYALIRQAPEALHSVHPRAWGSGFSFHF